MTRWNKTLFVYLWAIVLSFDLCTPRKINLGLLFQWEGANPVGSRGGGAAKIAIDEINSEKGKQHYGAIHAAGHELDFVWKNTNCETKVGLPVFSDLHNNNELGKAVDAYIGPGCSIICEPGGILAAHWKVPVVSWGCTSDTLSQKETYPTFARTTAPSKFSAPFFTAIMKNFNYDQVAIIYSSHHLWSLTAQILKTDFEENNITVATFNQFEPIEKLAEANLASIQREAGNKFKQLKAAKNKSRVFVVIAYGADVRDFLLDAKSLEMMDGTYAFFTMEVTLNGRLGADDKDAEAKQAFEGLLDVKLLKPETYTYMAFEEKVRNVTSHDPFNSTAFAGNPTGEVPIEAALLYNAVHLYAHALNTSLALENTTSGDVVSRYMFNVNFTGIDGYVVIDNSGDRHPNYMLQNIQNNTFRTVAHFFNNDPKYKDINRTIYWPGGGTEPPANGPECGWKEEFCPEGLSTTDLAIIIVSSVTFVIITCIVALFIYRNR